jgi:hypothetical protein
MLTLNKFITRRSAKNPVSPSVNEPIDSYNSAVIKMINLRRTVDERLQAEDPADYWPMYRLLETTEAIMANAVEFCEVLQGDGLSEAEAVKKMLSLWSTPQDECVDITSYLRLRLQVLDPDYLALGILDQAVMIAKEGAKAEIEKRQKQATYPRAGWLNDKVAHEAVLPGREGHRDCVRLYLRTRPEDEIWAFATPSDRPSPVYVKGLALMREGQIIDHAITNELHVSFAKGAYKD